MQETFLSVGLICIVAAIVGGGIRLLGGDIPVLNSRRRRIALFVLGLILLGAATSANPRGPLRRLLCYPVNFDRGMAGLGGVADINWSASAEERRQAADLSEAAHRAAADASKDDFCPMLR